jgi:hypothetical protein
MKMNATEVNATISAAKKRLDMGFVKYNAPDSFHDAKTIKGAGKGIYSYSTSPMDVCSKDKFVNETKSQIKKAFGLQYFVKETPFSITFAIPQGKKFKKVNFSIENFNAYPREHYYGNSGYTRSYFTMDKPALYSTLEDVRGV